MITLNITSFDSRSNQNFFALCIGYSKILDYVLFIHIFIRNFLPTLRHRQISLLKPLQPQTRLIIRRLRPLHISAFCIIRNRHHPAQTSAHAFIIARYPSPPSRHTTHVYATLSHCIIYQYVSKHTPTPCYSQLIKPTTTSMPA